MVKLTDFKDKKIYSIREMEAFFLEKDIPQEKIRFFVNENRGDSRCFGIYQDPDTGKYIVYKNKDDGSRFVRYEGYDEAKACDVFFSKLKDEMALREKSSDNTKKSYSNTRKSADWPKIIAYFTGAIAVVGVLISLALFAAGIFGPKTGYYYKDDHWYSYSGSNWYYYDDYYDDWYWYDGTIGDDYYYSYAVDDSMGVSDVVDSYNYIEPSDTSSDSSYSDSDFDSYDFDSWDSSDTDWGSDW
ncbi:MAG: hypothetical protein Q4D13_04260 [Erysipelotrichaceae bacterium]|nr:hypothetical protein [Erysipelotrichaceae bacterium]